MLCSGAQLRILIALTANMLRSCAEQRYTGSDTLEEPVTETIMRDIRAIYHKLLQVFIPGKGSRALLEWDLCVTTPSTLLARTQIRPPYDLSITYRWGPLVFCLTLAILLSVGVRIQKDVQRRRHCES